MSTITPPLTPYAADLGIDWADAKHDVCLQIAGSDVIEHHVLPHTPEALNEWVAGLRQRFGAGPLAVCLEQSKGALINFLISHDLFVLYPVNPRSLARFRETFQPPVAPKTINAMRPCSCSFSAVIGINSPRGFPTTPSPAKLLCSRKNAGKPSITARISSIN
jgi:hypothetical protein